MQLSVSRNCEYRRGRSHISKSTGLGCCATTQGAYIDNVLAVYCGVYILYFGCLLQCHLRPKLSNQSMRRKRRKRFLMR